MPSAISDVSFLLTALPSTSMGSCCFGHACHPPKPANQPRQLELCRALPFSAALLSLTHLLGKSLALTTQMSQKSETVNGLFTERFVTCLKTKVPDLGSE